MEKHVRMGWLLDFYGGLLTQRQQCLLGAYYNEDLSLAEIAENEGISRQAVHDALRHGEKALETYEDRLGLLERHLKLGETLNRGRILIKEDPVDLQALSAILQEALNLWEREG